MSHTPHERRVASFTQRLSQRALARDVPAELVQTAARATERTFCVRPWGSGSEAAMESYFSAVVRRRLVRSGAGARAVARMMAETVVADLQRSGREPSAVWGELERGWAHAIPADVLDEYRARLCA